MNDGPVPARVESSLTAKPPRVALSEEIVFSLWDLAQRKAQSVIDRCIIPYQAPGVVWGSLNVKEAPPMWYAIEVSAGWDGFDPEDSLQIEDGKRALRGEALGEGMQEELETLFTQTFYEL